MSEKGITTSSESAASYNDFENFKILVRDYLNENKIKFDGVIEDDSNFSCSIKLWGKISKTLGISFVKYGKEKHIATLAVRINQFSEQIKYYSETGKYYLQDPITGNFELTSKNFYELIERLSENDNFNIPDEWFFFDEKNTTTTEYLCPVCRYGKLAVEPNNIRIRPYNNYNKEIESDENFDTDFLKFSFSGFLKCNNINCNEEIAVCGIASVDYIDDIEGNCHYGYFCIPKFFDRIFDLINIDPLPDDDKKLLRESFHLYWVDEMSCANKIRCFIENMMTFLGVSKTSAKGGFKSLDSRINSCKKLSDEQKGLLLGIKYLGNSGTHENTPVSRRDIMYSLKTIEYLIPFVYHYEEMRHWAERLEQNYKE